MPDICDVFEMITSSFMKNRDFYGVHDHSLPLSFSEYMQGQSISPQAVWKEYIRTGGIPLVAQMVWD